MSQLVDTKVKDTLHHQWFLLCPPKGKTPKDVIIDGVKIRLALLSCMMSKRSLRKVKMNGFHFIQSEFK